MTLVLTTKMIIGIVVGVLGLMFCSFLYGVAFVIDYEKKRADRIPELEEVVKFERTGVIIKFKKEE